MMGKTMAQKREKSARTFWRELGNIGRRGRQVWQLVPFSQRVALGGAVFIMCVASVANTVIPLCLGWLVDAVNPQAGRDVTPDALLRLAASFLAAIGAAYIAREALNVLRRYLVENACTRIYKNMYVRLVSHLMKVELAVLAREQVGAIHGRISRSVEGFVRFLRISFLDFIPALSMGAFALAAALSKQPRVALAMAGVIPISVVLTLWQLITQKGVRLSLLRSRDALDGTVVEQLSGLDYIRAANTVGQEVRRVAAAAEKRRAKEIRHHFEMSLFGCAKALNEGFFHLLVIAFAIYLFIHGRIKYGDILAFSALYLNLMAPLNEIHRFIDEAHESSLRVGDLVSLLAEPHDRSFKPREPLEPSVALGAPLFVVDGLLVECGSGNGRPKRALDGVSLEVRHGETIGIAGRSGCGKSTSLRVLLRLAHPTGGSVMLGGVPLERVTRESIGRLIGYVGQNPFIFAGTIAENIAYGCDGVTEDQIRTAARLACIDEEILAMPGGYRTLVEERGKNLSGGQQQRITLARVFLKNPPVLILDEATSALDNICERKVRSAIAAARADRTVILVAHRLTTLLDSDRIIVFEDGQIVETGTYNELVGRGGAFAAMVHVATGDSAVSGGSSLSQSL
jgi:ATP-binding cassette subfamily B protein